MKFSVCLAKWSGPIPYFEAYREIAETVMYGLRRLGHNVILSEHQIESDRRNIIIGFHVIQPENLPSLPPGTILYQLEQVEDTELKPIFHAIGDRFTVWDYSLRNIERLNAIGVTRKVHVPIGYVPEMSRIPESSAQDIDVLFYGLVENRRGAVLQALRDAGLKVEVLLGIYGGKRDMYIRRTKVVLNMHLYEARIFEVARVSYLLANRKAVVSECGAETEIEDDLREALVLAEYDGLVEACIGLVEDAERRKHYEESGFAVMAARDEVEYLRAALEAGEGC